MTGLFNLAKANTETDQEAEHQLFAPLLEKLPEWAFYSIGDVAVWQMLGLAIALLLGFTARGIVRSAAKIIKSVQGRNPSIWHDRVLASIVNPLGLGVACGIWLISVHILGFDGLPLRAMTLLLKILITVSLVWIVSALCDLLKNHLLEYSRREDNSLDEQITNLIARCLKIFVIVIVALLGAQNMGLEVFPILTSLGIGGLAVALAAKDTLANFFGSVMIMVDRPFRVGHWIVVGDKEGTVEKIGFRSTRIRTFYNSIISIPNSELAIASIDNMGLRQFRRTRTTLGVTYDTPPEKIEAFIAGIRKILIDHPLVPDERIVVAFNSFGASSLDILVNFFLNVSETPDELKARHEILISILNLAKEMGVSFAFPTQTLHIESLPPK